MHRLQKWWDAVKKWRPGWSAVILLALLLLSCLSVRAGNLAEELCPETPLQSFLKLLIGDETGATCQDADRKRFLSFVGGLAPEFVGGLVTFALIELFLQRRIDQQREERELKELKADLILKMGSNVRDVAVPAAEKLRKRGWLSDGSLRGADLKGADLEGADLEEAHLEGAHLERAHLEEAHLEEAHLERAQMYWAHSEGAHLRRAHLREAKLGEAKLGEASLWMADLARANLEGANLEGAHLWGADLGGAKLTRANLRRANLEEADLSEADLSEADLSEADLGGAKLEGANFSVVSLLLVHLFGAKLKEANFLGARFDTKTVLPDGSHWTLGTDMECFTDPDHPDFWEPPHVSQSEES